MGKSKQKILLIVVIAALVAAFFFFDLGRFLTLDYLKSQRESFAQFYAEHAVLTLLVYFAIYVATTALSLPGAAILTLAGGALFGFVTGTILVSFASTIGATCAFLIARFILRDAVQQKFGEKLRAINEGVEREGSFYLFTLRLVPIFPFFVINVAMALTPIKTFQFMWVSQVGMLLGTMVYVNAGTQLGQLTSLKGILSPQLLLSFCLLGVFPIVAKKLLGFLQARRQTR